MSCPSLPCEESRYRGNYGTGLWTGLGYFQTSAVRYWMWIQVKIISRSAGKAVKGLPPAFSAVWTPSAPLWKLNLALLFDLSHCLCELLSAICLPNAVRSHLSKGEPSNLTYPTSISISASINPSAALERNCGGRILEDFILTDSNETYQYPCLC
jgi:hypothetical protein